MIETKKSHTYTGQVVFTWVPDVWPAGVLTGHADAEGGFVLAHVIAFDHTPTSALRLVRAGLQEAFWECGWKYVIFRVPHAHPKARGLKALARRVGAIEYATHHEESFFVRYADTPEQWVSTVPA